MYKTSIGFGDVEEDNYKEGVIGTGFSKVCDISFEAETKEEIVQKILNFYDVDENSIELNACGENGRIDVALTENGEGDKASDGEIEDWKKANIKLYYVVYTHYLSKSESVAF